MSEIPSQLKYASSHEWIQAEDDNLVRVGITDFAQQSLGDIMFIQLPTLGMRFNAGEQCAVVESVKTASDLFSPVTGVICAINDRLIDAPELVNEAPYQNWIFCLKADDSSELAALMTAADYQTMIE